MPPQNVGGRPAGLAPSNAMGGDAIDGVASAESAVMDDTPVEVPAPAEPAPTKKRRSRWGQEPDLPPMPDADALALAPMGMLPGYSLLPPGMSGMALALPPPGGVPMYPPPGPGGYNMDLSAAAQAAREALEKAKRAAMFQRQIQEQMAKLKTQGLAAGFLPGEGPKARKLILDEFGRELDEEGNVVPMRPQVVSTLKVNINREKEARLKKILGLKKEGSSESNYVDASLKTVVRFERAKRKTFRFVEEGSLVRKELRLVKKLQEKALGMDREREREKKGKKEDKKEDKKEAQDEDTHKAEVGVRKIEPRIMRREPIPDVEWWDMPFLKEDANGQKRAYTEVNVEKITPYVEHPIPIKITTEKEVPDAAMMYLTPKERKKLRRLKRQERTQEIRDKIKMGILQPPPPKVKMSNLMRVLGDEAIADPSTVERKVRQQVEQRRREHEQRNEARKLPAEERKQKKKQKWLAENEPTTQVLVFKIKDLANKRHLFKIDMNAQQFHLTGCCIACPGVANVVVVEGGPRAVKRYKKLMVRRIKWSEDQKDDDDDDDDDDEEVTAPKLQDHCVLIWEGVVKLRNFKNWKVTHARSEAEARKTLADRGAEHYWEMLARYRDPRMDI